MAKYKGTDGVDFYTLEDDGPDTVRMRGDNDVVRLSAAVYDVNEDLVDAGKGDFDIAILQDGGFYNFGHERFTGFEQMALTGKGAFEIYVDDSVARAGTTFTVYGAGSSSDEFQPSGVFLDWQPERDASLLFFGSNGKDAVIGGGVADTFNGGAGNDLMTGNEGADTFVFTGDAVAGDIWGKDRITDFRPGEDHLVFQSANVTSFDELLIERTREGLVIRTPDSASSVTLLGVLPRDLHASDVSFEPLSAHLAGHALTVPHELPLA